MGDDGLATIPGDYQYRALTSGPAFQRAWHREKLKLVDALVRPVDAGMRVLDVGCGSGVVAGHLAARDCTVVGVDGNASATHFAQERFGGPHATFAVSPLETLQPDPAAYDWILCLEVLEHLKPAAADSLLARLRHGAKATARLLVTTPNYRGTWPLVEWLADRSGKVAHLEGDQHVSRFTRARLRSSVRHAGWRVLQEGTYCTVAPVAGLLSERVEDRTFAWELRADLPFGNLLYLVAAAA